MIWYINITAAVLTGSRQQCNNSDWGPTSVMAGMHTVPEMKRFGGPDILLDFQVLTSIYYQKRIKVNVELKRITVQCV